MTIDAGDLVVATVVVDGSRVTLSLTDLTRGEAFTRTVADRGVDRSSAESIAEAPSDGTGATDCTTLALTDFGRVRFTAASAQSTSGVTGTVVSSAWQSTRLLLGYTRHEGELIPSGTASARAGGLSAGARDLTIPEAVRA